jgi:hypothetical protein
MQHTFDFLRPSPSLSITSAAQETDLREGAGAPRSLSTGCPPIEGRTGELLVASVELEDDGASGTVVSVKVWDGPGADLVRSVWMFEPVAIVIVDIVVCCVSCVVDCSLR